MGGCGEGTDVGDAFCGAGWFEAARREQGVEGRDGVRARILVMGRGVR